MTDKKSLQAYFDVPFFEREEKKYDFDFLSGYDPNKTFFLTEKQRKTLHEAVKNCQLSTIFYQENKRLLETILIDISYASSALEGNTYSYFDTEVLIKYHEVSVNKTQDETTMILNHKKALEFILDLKSEKAVTADMIYYVHRLLGRGLLPDADLGVIRKKTVKIGGSTYQPIDNPQKLQEEFHVFLQKLNHIKDPFEKSVFIGIFIPYFQIFLDINKRTSRLTMNLPLLMNNLPLISFLGSKQGDYFRSLITVYELQKTQLFTDLYVANFLRNMDRYIG